MNRLKSWGVFIFVLTFSVTVLAQYEGRILGTITDQSGGAVKDARVIITNVDTGVPRNLSTNEAGDYVAPNLPPGMYRITVEATGFKRIERTGVRLEVGKDVRIDLSLTPGDIAETIRVTGDAPLIETTNDTQGGSFANKAINDLPLNGRDYQNLVVLRPGVQRYIGGGFLSISSNGNRPEDNNFIVDGIDNNDPYYGAQVINTEGVQGTPGSILPIDAIQEFNVVENPPADYGWKPGAIINLGIKSGTNDVHGTAYYFNRNDKLDARNFFNTPPDPKKELSQHQFGGSLGGPVVKNKTFLFGAYEGVRALISNSNGVNTPATVPLAGGDPTNSIPDAIAALAARGIPVNPLSRNLIGTGAFTGNGPFPGLFPVNNGTNSQGPSVIITGFPNTNRMDAFIIKGDHHFNDRHSITARYFLGDSLQQEQDIAVLRPEWRSQSQLRAQVVGANYTWTPSSRWVNEAKFGYNRFWQAILTVDHDKNPVSTYGINAANITNPVNFGMPRIDISGFNQVGGNSGWPLLTIPNETYQVADNVSYTRGRHTFRFGGEFREGKTDNLRNRRGKGRIRFLGDAAFAGSTPLEDFLAGFPTRGEIFIGDSERHVSIRSFGAFFQDDWRVSNRLTVNLGVRYDLNSAIRERKNLLGNFDPAVGLQQVGVNISSPYNTDFNNFAPRLGIAWDPWGKGKTVIRAGGAIIYEIPHLAIFLGQNGINNATTPGLNVIPTAAVGSNLFGHGGTILGAATTQRGGLNWTVAGPIFNAAIDCTANPCDILGVARNLRTPYVITWNFNVQQAFGNSTSLQVGYVGNRGVKLYSIRDINQVNPALDDGGEQVGRPFNARFPFLGFINFMENGYTSTYHALQASLTQRVWHGLTFVAGYTYSHAIDDVSLNRAFQPQDSNRARLERGSSDNDVRHRFTLALTYDLPSKKGWGQMLEGWQVNSIVVLQTGFPWSAYDFDNDVSLTGEFSDRWNINGDPSRLHFSPGSPIPCTNSSGSSAFDAGGVCHAYANGLLTMPAPGTFGNMGRNIFLGPPFKNWDFSVVKTFRFGERVSVQVRGEFFNVLNHPNIANPQSTSLIFTANDLGNPGGFGLTNFTPDVSAANPVIGAGGARNIQLGLKFRF
jgi:hypothetical protein